MGIAASVAGAVKKVAQAVPEGRVKDFVKSTIKKEQSTWAIKYSKEVFRPVAFIPGTHYTLQPKLGVGLGLAVGAYGLSQDAERIKNDARLSDMQADEMANMVNVSRSPNIAEYDNARDESLNTKSELRDAKRHTPYDLRTGNAAGDLVFALHELKNGGR